ncbi:unnamed protein product [Phytophthora fragariaefolia]|uniref:Unnamed protein product n=1 Tax=Phytophthora fragariaefolia TaxID=1490495 RepID=A0A9W7CVQ9_9STRA|nr:unnamed protein product [Phytophthora fragariaefolia]
MSDAEPTDRPAPTGSTPPPPAHPSGAPPVGGGGSGGDGVERGHGAASGGGSDGDKLTDNTETGDPDQGLLAVQAGLPDAGRSEGKTSDLEAVTRDEDMVDVRGDPPVEQERGADRPGETSVASSTLTGDNKPLGTVSLRVISRAAAHLVFQVELDQVWDSRQATASSEPSLMGHLPPTRFDAPSSIRVTDTKFIGVPVSAQDCLEDSSLCDGFGLEALVGVEGLSEAQVRKIARRVAPSANTDRDFLVAQDSDWTPSEFIALLECPVVKRELAVQLYGVEHLARRVFWMFTLFRSTLDRLNQAETRLKMTSRSTLTLSFGKSSVNSGCSRNTSRGCSPLIAKDGPSGSGS